MPNFNSKRRFFSGNIHLNPGRGHLAPDDEDIMMEQILENIHTTPIGQLLQKIASLPEVRQEKILDVRQQLTEGKYELNERLDVAIDRVLEHLTS
jgi:hypothetical protein